MSRMPKNRKRRGIALLVLTAAGCLFAFAPAEGATQVVTLSIETVPALRGIPFRVDGRPFVTDGQGVAHVTLPQAGVYELTSPNHMLLGDERRIELAGWSDGGFGARRELDTRVTTRLQVGFHVDYLVEEIYRDEEGRILSPDDIDSVTVVDDEGLSRTHPGASAGLAGPTALLWQRFPPGFRWLRALRTAAGDQGLRAEKVSYEVRSITVEGRRSEASSSPFTPSAGGSWLIQAPDASRSYTLIGVAGAALLLAGAYSTLIVVRRTRASSSKHQLPWKSSRQSTRKPARARKESEKPREFVRVRLRNGRTVEGWRSSQPAGDDSQVLMIDVTRVLGPDGSTLQSVPLDSFVLRSQIIELQEVALDRTPAPST